MTEAEVLKVLEEYTSVGMDEETTDIHSAAAEIARMWEERTTRANEAMDDLDRITRRLRDRDLPLMQASGLLDGVSRRMRQVLATQAERGEEG